MWEFGFDEAAHSPGTLNDVPVIQTINVPRKEPEVQTGKKNFVSWRSDTSHVAPDGLHNLQRTQMMRYISGIGLGGFCFKKLYYAMLQFLNGCSFYYADTMLIMPSVYNMHVQLLQADQIKDLKSELPSYLL